MSEFGNFIACFPLDSFKVIFGVPSFGIQPHTLTGQHCENSDLGAHVSAGGRGMVYGHTAKKTSKDVLSFRKPRELVVCFLAFYLLMTSQNTASSCPTLGLI